MTQPKNDKQYRHDCYECKYLGTIRERGVLVDLYIHKHKGTPNWDTFIGRYGSDEANYTSAARDIVEKNFMITHTCRQAWRIEQDRLEVVEESFEVY